MKRILTCLTALFVFIGVQQTVLAEEITIGGGGAALDGVIKPVKGAFEKSTGITVKLNYSNDILSLKNLLEGKVNASTFGGSYEDYVKLVQKNNIPFSANDFTATQIGKASIYTIAHKSNSVKALSKEQLKGIFTGKITNWKEVGGSDLPIIVVLSLTNTATNNAFQKMVQDGEPLTKEFLDANTFKDISNKVASNPEAIAFGPLSLVDGTVKNIETPGFYRPINILTKGQPSAAVGKLITFITAEGK